MTVHISRTYKVELHPGEDRTLSRFKLKPQLENIKDVYEATIYIGADNSLDCRILLPILNENDITSVDKIFEEIENKIKENSFVKDSYVIQGNLVIITDELPDFKVSFSKIILNFGALSNKPVSLHNIHKILDCGILEINGANLVKDSVLGILAMKRLKMIDYFNLNAQPEWYKIVIKHFESPAKDILECQEELIENGLKEYAKL